MTSRQCFQLFYEAEVANYNFWGNLADTFHSRQAGRFDIATGGIEVKYVREM